MSKHLQTEIRVPIDDDNVSIMRHEEKCIKCGQCKNVCEDYISVLGTYSLEHTGDKAICINCGQCANICPAKSITEKYEYASVRDIIKSKNKTVIFSTSPSVRVGLGEEFGEETGSFVEGKMVAMLRALGGNYVLDTNFAADLTILEEASELIERITKGSSPLPQFTSCCPSWVKFAETYYPEILPNISTSKSPIGMQGPTIKTYFAKKMSINPKDIVNVAVTPCTAKKYEIRREEMNAASKYLGIEGLRDFDYVITTRELAMWAKEDGIDYKALKDSSFDKIMGEASGAGVIFANTGGVMEAAVRTAYEYITKESAPEILFDLEPIRGMEGIKDATLNIGGTNVNLAVVYGTGNAREIIKQVKSGEKQYHFIEVMTCPGGCIGGGGQPKQDKYGDNSAREKRIESIYKKDSAMKNRKSHENEEIKTLYKEFYGKPLSELAEKMLHTFYTDKSGDLGGYVKEPVKKAKVEYRCTVCGYIHSGEIDDDYKCPVCGEGKNRFEKLGSTEGGVKYKCDVCRYIHEGEIPDGYKCPVCGEGKSSFIRM